VSQVVDVANIGIQVDYTSPGLASILLSDVPVDYKIQVVPNDGRTVLQSTIGESEVFVQVGGMRLSQSYKIYISGIFVTGSSMPVAIIPAYPSAFTFPSIISNAVVSTSRESNSMTCMKSCILWVNFH